MNIASSRQNQEDLLGETGKGTDQVLNLSLLLNLIHAADSGNYPLNGFRSFPAVLNDLEVLVLTGFFDSRKHGEPPELVTPYLWVSLRYVNNYQRILWHHIFENLPLFQRATQPLQGVTM